ncbi:hypothetical protein [Pedobacter jeongneungensis]|uniref:hypothetical protein n=1 Tax=Pedobacter jeongneungensis TaxID=947309 RepID=UPI000469ACA2|nr:hypothetical protein [Pedobacter jeongneungensis]
MKTTNSAEIDEIIASVPSWKIRWGTILVIIFLSVIMSFTSLININEDVKVSIQIIGRNKMDVFQQDVNRNQKVLCLYENNINSKELAEDNVSERRKDIDDQNSLNRKYVAKIKIFGYKEHNIKKGDIMNINLDNFSNKNYQPIICKINYIYGRYYLGNFTGIVKFEIMSKKNIYLENGIFANGEIITGSNSLLKMFFKNIFRF